MHGPTSGSPQWALRRRAMTVVSSHSTLSRRALLRTNTPTRKQRNKQQRFGIQRVPFDPLMICVLSQSHLLRLNYVRLNYRNSAASGLSRLDGDDSRWHFSAHPPDGNLPCLCSARPAVGLATGTAWSCAKAARAATLCQNPSAQNTVGPPQGYAATSSAAPRLCGSQAHGER